MLPRQVLDGEGRELCLTHPQVSLSISTGQGRSLRMEKERGYGEEVGMELVPVKKDFSALLQMPVAQELAQASHSALSLPPSPSPCLRRRCRMFTSHLITLSGPKHRGLRSTTFHSGYLPG